VKNTFGFKLYIIAPVKEAEKIGQGSPRMSAPALRNAVH
jgi:hypothetical protein